VYLDSTGPNGAIVDVTLGSPLTCVPSSPLGQFSPTTQTASPGNATTFTIDVTNADVICPIALLLRTFNVPAGWESPELTGFEATLMPGGARQLVVNVVVTPGTAPGAYPISIALVNTFSTASINFAATVTVP
jgi:hypothetical protein